MARFEVRGIEEYVQKLQALDKHTRDRVIGKSIYNGAGILADAVREGIEALPVGKTDEKGALREKLNGPEKDGLRDGFGITRMTEKNGFINVKVGWEGYNRIRTKKYPKGQPNAMIARSINHGTSRRKKIRFLDNAYFRTKKKVTEVMSKTCDAEIEKIMKGS